MGVIAMLVVGGAEAPLVIKIRCQELLLFHDQC
jgi:hypothetical protein